MSASRPLATAALALILAAASACGSRRSPPVFSAEIAGPPAWIARSAPAPAIADQGGVADLNAAERAALASAFEQTAGTRVFFSVDSEALNDQARTVLDAQAAWLRQNPRLRLLIAGHADERGTREYNLGLGARRAQAARAHLIRSGVPLERLDTTSYGKERPFSAGADETAWARNRNAHTILIDLVPAD